MGKDIKLSKEHGLNPSIDTCFICGSEIGITLFGDSYRNKDGKKDKAPMYVCTGNICDKCKEIIKQGNVFILEVTDSSNKNNIERTGRYIAITQNKDNPFSSVNYMIRSEFNKLVQDN